ncbi:MAG: bifunctional diguanylate cyclase/phosphodiesterase [Francisellaceae bacterium]|nr:bifunctional diguanylate cyclase/phosphodiesterase [Francisellaceae bacterium]
MLISKPALIETLSDFFLMPGDPINGLQGTFNLPLVFLSYAILVVTSYIALDFSTRLRTNPSSSLKNFIGLIIGSLTLGMGIWSMHFIGMLAFKLPIPMVYQLHSILLSLSVSILISMYVLNLLKNKNIGFIHLTLGGIFLGIGITTMHYLGISALNSQLRIRYIPSLFFLSLFIAISVSQCAMWISLISDKSSFKYKLSLRLVSSLLLGIGICGMYYIGIQAVVFTPRHNARLIFDAIDENQLAIFIASTTLVIIVISQFISQYSRELLTLSLKNRNQELSDAQNILKENNENLEIHIKNRTEDLEKLLSFTKATLESTTDGILVENLDGIFTGFNQKLLKMMDIPESFMQLSSDKTFEYLSEQVLHKQEFLNKIKEHQSNKELVNFETIRFTNKKVFELYTQPQWYHDQIIGRVWSFRDITIRAHMEENLLYQATHDSLTNLPNRVLLYEQLNAMLEEAKKNQWSVVVLFIDFDRFKIINDSLGHNYGDNLLKLISERVSNSINSNEICSRLGGDEFIISINQVTDLSKINDRLKFFQEIFNTPFMVNNRTFNITASIGISIYPQDGTTVVDLLKNADAAMYYSKNLGGNTIQWYTAEMNKENLRKFELEQQLRLALSNNEFVLHYQPLVDLSDKKPVGVEALIRWFNPKLGHIGPQEFIPIAEETGLILDIGKWVLETACEQAKKWQTQGLSAIKVSVNLSSKQLNQKTLISVITKILNDTEIDPSLLELELTESGLINQSSLVNEFMSALNLMGICLSIDDFGTGYSGINYLKKFPITKLKIDKSYVDDLNKSTESQKMVNAIINLAKSLNINVLAEGIETEEQYAILKQLQCNQGQGYLFSKPLPADKCTELLLKYLD